MPAYRFLKNYVEFEDKYFDPYLKRALEINSGKNLELPEDIKRRTGILERVFSDARAFEDGMVNASKEIKKHVSDTYRILYRFANRDHKDLLDEDMMHLLEER